MFLPFLNGPEFLGLYAALWGGFLVFLIVLNLWIKRKAPLFGEAMPDLKPMEVAYLANGPAGAINVSIIRLGALGVFKLDESGKILRTELPLSKAVGQLTTLEELIANLFKPGDALKPESVNNASKDLLEPIRVRLEDHQLVVPSSTHSLFFKCFWAVFFALVLFGAARGISGLINDKPSAFIWILTAVLPVVSMIVLGVISGIRTVGGNRFLANLQKQNAALKTGAQQLNDPGHADQMALAVALFGVLALGAIGANPWARALLPFQPAGSSGGGDYSSNSCSDGGSSSSSDGGGGGGGGCGGCGGGGGGD